MGWWVYNASKKWWELGPNLRYGTCSEWVTSGQNVMGFKSVKRSKSNNVAEERHWLYLNLFSDLKFSRLRQAMAKAVGQPSQTLLMYSDVVRSNVVGDTEKCRTNATVPVRLTFNLYTCNGYPYVVRLWMWWKCIWARVVEDW